MRHGKTKFATVKYNLFLQIIQSQTCYTLNVLYVKLIRAVIYDAFQDMEEKHSLHHQLQDKLENYWGQFDHALRNYKETNAERRAAFEELKAKDDESAKEIDTQMRKLQRISVIVLQKCVGIHVFCIELWIQPVFIISALQVHFCIWNLFTLSIYFVNF